MLPEVKTPDRPAWREPMVWLMLGLPAACLLAIALTLRSAADPDATAISNDRVARTAQVQTTDIVADRRAEELGLRAILARDDRQLRLQLEVPGARPARLRLLAAHPTRAALDVVIWLQPQADGSWQAEMSDVHGWPAADSAWSLSLTPEDASWRIDGHLQPGQAETELAPRFGHD